MGVNEPKDPSLEKIWIKHSNEEAAKMVATEDELDATKEAAWDVERIKYNYLLDQFTLLDSQQTNAFELINELLLRIQQHVAYVYNNKFFEVPKPEYVNQSRTTEEVEENFIEWRDGLRDIIIKLDGLIAGQSTVRYTECIKELCSHVLNGFECSVPDDAQSESND